MRLGFVLLSALTMMCSAAASAHEYTAGDLFIDHPAVNVTPPGSKVAVGYMTIKNNGNTDDVLLGVEAPGLSKRPEIHSMTMDGGAMKMRKLEALTIPAHGQAALSPNGTHIMFMDLASAVKEDSSFDATLRFKNAGDVKVKFNGAPIGSGGDASSHAHHH